MGEATVDLNLLHVLDALLVEESVSRAAQRMHMTVPSMSRALSRLREQLHDPLLVRAGRTMVLTSFAYELRARAHAARAEANAVLSPAGHATLASLQRTLVVRASDAVATVFAAELSARLGRQMPRARVAFVPEGDEDAAALREGRVDVDVGVLDFQQPELVTRRLFSDTFSFVVSQQHRLAGRRATLKQLAGCPHVVVSRKGQAWGPVDEALRAQGLRRRVTAVMPSFLSAALACVGSEVVALVPLKVAEYVWGPLGVATALVSTPLKLPAIHVGMAWHPRSHHDSSCVWLRQQLIEMSSELANQSVFPQRVGKRFGQQFMPSIK